MSADGAGASSSDGTAGTGVVDTDGSKHPAQVGGEGGKEVEEEGRDRITRILHSMGADRFGECKRDIPVYRSVASGIYMGHAGNRWTHDGVIVGR